jgi:hypothetical protein
MQYYFMIIILIPLRNFDLRIIFVNRFMALIGYIILKLYDLILELLLIGTFEIVFVYFIL